MKKSVMAVCVCLAAVMFSGCSSLSRSDKMMLHELKSYGARDFEEVKSPVVAGVLQILPGVGNFYLASGTDESQQYTAGILNIIPGWLVWPVGILWAAPQGVIDAGVINKKEAIYYYTYDPMGKSELAKMKKDFNSINDPSDSPIQRSVSAK